MPCDMLCVLSPVLLGAGGDSPSAQRAEKLAWSDSAAASRVQAAVCKFVTVWDGKMGQGGCPWRRGGCWVQDSPYH